MKVIVMLAVLALGAGPAAEARAPAKPKPKTRGVRIIPAQEAPPAPPAETPPPPVYPVSPMPSTPDPAPAPAPVAPPAPAANTAAARCDRAFPAADLTYVDARDFDTRLRDLLAASTASSRVLDTPAFAPDTPPARLQPWLAEVQRTGGRVSSREISCTRTRGFSLLKFLSKIFKPPTESVYAPAKDWDAVLWTEKAGGQVRQVQFTRRAAPSAG
jgi:hypothetical protein